MKSAAEGVADLMRAEPPVLTMVCSDGAEVLLRIPDAADVFHYELQRVRWRRDRRTGRMAPHIQHLPISRAVAARLVAAHAPHAPYTLQTTRG